MENTSLFKKCKFKEAANSKKLELFRRAPNMVFMKESGYFKHSVILAGLHKQINNLLSKREFYFWYTASI